MPDPLLCASCLVYTNRPESIAASKVRDLIRRVKVDEVDANGQLWTDRIVLRLAEQLPPEWTDWIGPDVALVPVPRATLTKRDSVWPARTICRAMVRTGLAGAVLPILYRTSAVPKSAVSRTRPTLHQHVDSLAVQAALDTPRRIVLVDDVVTRGTTMLAARQTLGASVPASSHILAFALARAADRQESHLGFAPRLDVILPRGDATVRRPFRRS